MRATLHELTSTAEREHDSPWEPLHVERGFARDIIVPEQGPLGVKIFQEGFGSLRGAIGTPEQIRDMAARYEAAYQQLTAAGLHVHMSSRARIEDNGRTVVVVVVEVVFRLRDKDTNFNTKYGGFVDVGLVVERE